MIGHAASCSCGECTPLPLFLATPHPQPAPYVQGSETSRAAAQHVGNATGAMREAVLRFLADRGDEGATDEEIGSALRLGGSTARPRRVELVAAGCVRDSGKRRPTTSGRAATVWVRAP